MGMIAAHPGWPAFVNTFQTPAINNHGYTQTYDQPYYRSYGIHLDRPHSLVEADGLDYELIAFPLADRVAHPGGREFLRILRKRAPIGEDLAAQVVHFVQDQRLVRRMNDLERIRLGVGVRDAV